MRGFLTSGLLMFFTLTAAAAEQCPPVSDRDFICGLNNAEDMVAVEGTSWLLVGDMGDTHWQQGGVVAVDLPSRQRHAVAIDWEEEYRSDLAQENCRAPQPGRFSAHGMKIRRTDSAITELLVVNHGGRESIEIFEVTATSALEPSLTWRGCVLMPEKTSPNSVAVVSNNELLVTSLMDPSDPDTWSKLSIGKATGGVWRWRNRQWSLVPGSELAGANGVVASADGQWAFVAEWATGKLHKVALADGLPKVPPLKLGFRADNITWSKDGNLLVTGQAATLDDIAGCGHADVQVCQVDTVVAEVTSDSLRLLNQLHLPANEAFGAGTTALEVGNQWWIGTFKGRGIVSMQRP